MTDTDTSSQSNHNQEDDKYFFPLANADPDTNSIFNQCSIPCDYYSDNSFKSFCIEKSISNENCFSLFHQNIRSLNNPKNYANLNNYLDILSINFTVIGLTETWLDKDKVHNVSIDNYNHHASYRTERGGGGVSLFIKEGIQFSPRNDLVASIGDEAEAVFIELIEPFFKKKLIVGCIYRPPSSNTNLFIDCFYNTLGTITNEHKTCYIMSDTNINLFSNQSAKFIDLINASSFRPLITKATRITPTSKTLIDNIFTNHASMCGEPGVLCCDLSDHLPVFYLDPQTVNVDSNQSKEFFVRNFNNSSIGKFNNELSTVNWNAVLNEYETQASYNIFHGIFFKLFDKAFPLQKKKSQAKKQNQAWLTTGLKRSITKKHKLYRDYLTNPSPLNSNRYTTYRNK